MIFENIFIFYSRKNIVLNFYFQLFYAEYESTNPQLSNAPKNMSIESVLAKLELNTFARP